MPALSFGNSGRKAMAHGMTPERRKALERLSVRLGIRFADISLLDEALTHSSYANESRKLIPHNERLEYLGDAVLELASSTYLYECFPACTEGELTKMRASLVQSETLARLARRLDLGAYLRLGHGEAQDGGAERQNNLENAFEAVVGAVYLDGGWEAAKDYAYAQLASEVGRLRPEQVQRDYKTTLQEYIQKTRRETVAYELVDESGPDHDKRFTTRVLVAGRAMGEGTGRSKKKAEQQAAAHALDRLGHS